MEGKERGIKFEEFRTLLEHRRFIILSALIRNFIIEKFNIKKMKEQRVRFSPAGFQPSSQSSNIFIIDFRKLYFLARFGGEKNQIFRDKLRRKSVWIGFNIFSWGQHFVG